MGETRANVPKLVPHKFDDCFNMLISLQRLKLKV